MNKRLMKILVRDEIYSCLALAKHGFIPKLHKDKKTLCMNRYQSMRVRCLSDSAIRIYSILHRDNPAAIIIFRQVLIKVIVPLLKAIIIAAGASASYETIKEKVTNPLAQKIIDKAEKLDREKNNEDITYQQVLAREIKRDLDRLLNVLKKEGNYYVYKKIKEPYQKIRNLV